MVLLVRCVTRYPDLCLTFEGQNNCLQKLSLTSLFFPMQSFTLKASSVSSLIFFLFFIFYLLTSLSVHSYPFLNSFIKTICALLSFLLFLFKTPCNVRFLLRLHSKAPSDHSNSNPGLTKHWVREEKERASTSCKNGDKTAEKCTAYGCNEKTLHKSSCSKLVSC